MRTAILKKLASRRPFVRFPDQSTIALATPDVMEFARASPKAAWPASVAVVADDSPNSVVLKIDQPKRSQVKDPLRLTTPLRRSSQGLVTHVLSVDDELVPRDTTPQALAALLRDARRFTVARMKRSLKALHGNVSVEDAEKRWGSKQPVIGTIRLLDGLKRRLRIRLYNTPGLAKSLVVHRGRLTIVNLHPQDVLRIKKFTSWTAGGLRLSVRATNVEGLFSAAHSSRELKVKVLTRAPAGTGVVTEVPIVALGKMRADAKIHDAAAAIAKTKKVSVAKIESDIAIVTMAALKADPAKKKKPTTVAADSVHVISRKSNSLAANAADESDVAIVTKAMVKPGASKKEKKLTATADGAEKRTAAQRRHAIATAAAAAAAANSAPVASTTDTDQSPTPDVEGVEL